LVFIREELIMICMHPTRFEKMDRIEMGGEIDDF
jgi:hypothetical protein